MPAATQHHGSEPCAARLVHGDGSVGRWHSASGQPGAARLGRHGCESSGQIIPFAKTKAERDASGDPRLSLEERYADHDAYVAAVTQAANALAQDRLLLPADVQRYIDNAQASDVLK